MELITRETKAAGAARRWHELYDRSAPDYRLSGERDPRAIAAALDALGPSPSPDAVERVIGSPGWTDPGSCRECGQRAPALVRIGEELDYDSLTTEVCGPCLLRALQLHEG